MDATAQIMDGVPAIMNRSEAWKNVIPPRSRQVEFAREAWNLKPNDAIPPVWLLTARREESFQVFVRVHGEPSDPPGTLAVFQGHAVVARVLVARDNETGDPVPYLKEIDPPPRQHSPACGD